ncbi:MAG: hypothetical protein JWR50_3012 [Mucilaginibacter sp.]|nr:hypothetical protein [Mucilaginibacter sp.]
MEATTAVRGVGTTVRPFARCKRSTAQPAKKRTARVSRNGFLSHPFKPFWAYSGNKDRAEREFLCSLSNLCKHYDLPIPDCINGNFPQSIYYTLQAVTEQLKKVDRKLQCIIAKDDRHITTLATVRQYNTGMTLYYIPVRPLWHWVQSSQGQHIAELLLGIFAYLHQVVGIPFFSEPSSYLASQYKYIEQMIKDEQDGEPDRQQQLDEVYTLKNAGIKLHRQVSPPERLAAFEDTVLNFRHTDNWELEWKSVASDFLQLYQQYPDRNIFDRIHSDLLYPADEDRISVDQYISFYWSGDDCLNECLFDMINDHFQEIAYMDEPMQVQLFDAPPENTTPDFDFENRLFGLLNKLSKLLSDYDYEER